MEEDIRKTKDIWDKLEIIAKAFIPVIIAFLGYQYNSAQQEINAANITAQAHIDEKNRKADRLTGMIKNLASDNPKERIIAMNVANSLYLSGQLPAAIGPIIIDASKSLDQAEAEAAKSFAIVQSLTRVQKREGITDLPEKNAGQTLMTGDQSMLIYPVRDGNDVIVPKLLINAIPGFDHTKPVYAASNINGWLVSGKSNTNTEALRLTTMKKEGSTWRAYGMAEKRFHPAQLINSDLPDPFIGNNIAWAKIENVYKLSDSFVDMSGSGPSIRVE